MPEGGITGNIWTLPQGLKKDWLALNRIFNDLDALDGIITLGIDRFGRSAMQLAMNVRKLKDKGKFFEAIDQGLKISEKKGPMNDFMLAILGAAAEFERELISERVRDGMARARNEHKKIGRPVILEKKGIDISKILDLKESGKSIREISQLVGIKRPTLHGTLKSVSEKSTPEN